jgi:hypothetical protein
MHDDLTRELQKHGNLMRDAATVIQHQENDLNIAHRLLEESLALVTDETYRKRVENYLMLV